MVMLLPSSREDSEDDSDHDQANLERSIDSLGPSVQRDQSGIVLDGSCPHEPVVHGSTRDSQRNEPLDQLGKATPWNLGASVESSRRSNAKPRRATAGAAEGGE